VSEATDSHDGRWPFSHVERVRFGDLDAMRHLNNVVFLRYFETTRVAYVMSLLPDHLPGAAQPFGFIFAECHIAYRSPAHFNEDVRTYIAPAELRRSSVRLDFEMRADGDGRLVAEGYGVIVGYDHETQSAQPLPEHVREVFERELREAARSGD
jgi:acyl-CoA thioester hydrolase